MDKGILTTGEVARHCGVNFRTVIRWIERGHLRAYKLPGRGDNRIEIGDFLAFLKEHGMPVPQVFGPQHKGVLIVDDDRSMAHSIQRVLRSAGFETLVASDGFQAGALLGSSSPAVMTLDLKMPGISGLEVLSFVRGNQALSGVKILIVSALPRQELERALGAGADDALEKPFVQEELVAKVAQLAGAGVRRQEARP